MKIEIFTPDLSNRHEITNAISVQFSDLYNGIGKFTIVLPMDDYNIGVAENDAIVYMVDRNLAYEVAEVVYNCNENTVTINGYSLNNRLNRRVVAAEKKIVNVESDVYAVVSSNLRELPVLLADAEGLTETVEETSVSGDGLLDAFLPVLNEAELGNRMLFDYRAKTLTWQIYKGVDRTAGLQAVSFVQERGTAPGLSIDNDVSEYKNVCYCDAEYTQKTRSQTEDGTQTETTTKIKFTVTVGNATGIDRREMWVKFSGDSQSDGESLATFKSRVTRWAQEQLAEKNKRLGFSVNAVADELGKMYNVGDMVWCVSLRHNVKFKTRITEAAYTMDQNGSSISLTIGDPMLTVNVR